MLVIRDTINTDYHQADS